MPYTSVSVSYANASDIAMELQLAHNGSDFVLWGKSIETRTLTHYANRGNDGVYALVGDVSSSTTYKNNLAVRLASKYGARDLVTHMAVHWVDYAFDFQIGEQNVSRGRAVVDGLNILKEQLDKDIHNLEFKLSATVEGYGIDEGSREIYTDPDASPYMP
jgi:stress-induced morphogen